MGWWKVAPVRHHGDTRSWGTVELGVLVISGVVQVGVDRGKDEVDTRQD